MANGKNKEMKFVPLPPFPGGIYAEMLKGALEEEGITCYISSEGMEGAFGISGTVLPNADLRLYVPENRYEHCLRIQREMITRHD
ncbi:DUF2007 domain-containing protein [bacterium]|nr:DUF2007 domain-containing protein [bacterium]